MRLQTLYLLLACVVMLGGCSRCEDDPKPVDPCANVKAVSAAFRSQEIQSGTLSDSLWNRYYDSDTLISPYIQFTAKDSAASSYRWYAGDTTYTTRGISFTNGVPIGRPFPITLVVTHKANPNNCLNPSQLKDSVTRNIVVLPRYATYGKHLIRGRFRGYLNGNPSDTVTLTFVSDSVRPDDNFPKIYTYNFWPKHKFFTSYSPDFEFRSYRMITFGETGQLGTAPPPNLNDPSYPSLALWGVAEIAQSGLVRMHYCTRVRYYDQNNRVVADTFRSCHFIGRKLSKNP